MIIVNPYKNGSKSVAELKKAAAGVELKLEGSKFVGAARKKVINWGASQVSREVAKCNILNKPEAVGLAGNKLKFFEQMERAGHRDLCVPYTTDIGKADLWVAQGASVVARTKLNGHSGEGIILVEERVGGVPRAPLYTQYIAKKQEYRVHVVGDDVIDIQRKARKKDVPDDKVNWKVRNLDGGFIYARDFEPADLPAGIQDMALKVVKACGLDFGAVDIIFNDKQKRCYVLEVNTAPGLQGTTLEAYVAAFKKNGFIFEV